MFKNIIAVLLLVTCLLAGGCGGPGYELVPVSGCITLDGKPMPGLHVTFQPKSSGKEHSNPGPGSVGGPTDADGRFSLRTVGAGIKGAVAGLHGVVIVVASKDDEEELDDSPLAPHKTLLPNCCLDGSLTFTVPEQGTDAADFELKSSKH